MYLVFLTKFTGKIFEISEEKIFSDLLKTLKCSIYQKAYYQGIQ